MITITLANPDPKHQPRYERLGFEKGVLRTNAPPRPDLFPTLVSLRTFWKIEIQGDCVCLVDWQRANIRGWIDMAGRQNLGIVIDNVLLTHGEAIGWIEYCFNRNLEVVIERADHKIVLCSGLVPAS